VILACGRMIQKEAKVGKKGQVVIPKAMREVLKITPGSKVQFTLEGDKITVKPFFDAVAVFRRIAESGQSVSEINPRGAYEEELEERLKRTIKRGIK
jgi:AbrB family looped-hinge helix DNA binding protein